MKHSFIKPTKVILINGYVNSLSNWVLVLILINSKKINRRTPIKIYKHLHSKFRILFGDYVKDQRKIINIYTLLTKTRRPYDITINNQYYRVYFIKEGKRNQKLNLKLQKKDLIINKTINKIGKARKITPLKTIVEVFKKL